RRLLPLGRGGFAQRAGARRRQGAVQGEAGGPESGGLTRHARRVDRNPRGTSGGQGEGPVLRTRGATVASPLSLRRTTASALGALVLAALPAAADDCTPTRMGSLLRALLDEPWWTYSWSDMERHWPQPLSRTLPCIPGSVPCWNYQYSPNADPQDC